MKRQRHPVIDVIAGAQVDAAVNAAASLLLIKEGDVGGGVCPGGAPLAGLIVALMGALHLAPASRVLFLPLSAGLEPRNSILLIIPLLARTDFFGIVFSPAQAFCINLLAMLPDGGLTLLLMTRLARGLPAIRAAPVAIEVVERLLHPTHAARFSGQSPDSPYL